MLGNPNMADLAVIAVMLVSIVCAIIRGFVWEILATFGWLAAIAACAYFGPVVVPFVRMAVSAPWIAEFLGYGAVFLIVFIPLTVMSNHVAGKLSSTPVRRIDRIFGASFGLLRGLVLVGFAYIAFTWSVPIPQQPAWVIDAKTLPMIQATDAVLLSLLPPQDHPDFTRAPAPGEVVHNDILGDLDRCGRASGQPSCYRNGAVMNAPGVLEK